MHIGPDSLIVAARVALADELVANEAEDLADEIDRRLCAAPGATARVHRPDAASRPRFT
jgi:hypothetical protein